MEKKKAIIYFIFSILFASLTTAIQIDIEVADSFKTDEVVSFDYIMTSDMDKEVKFYPYVECPTAPLPLMEEKTIELTANVPYSDSYSSFTVSEHIEPQICTAYIGIMDSVEERIEKQFNIATNPSFSLNIELDKKVFVKGEDVFIAYTSEVEDPEMTAILTYPNKKTEPITLPTSIKADQIGTYELDVTASKEGYKTMTKKEQFGVIEEEAEIKDASECNANGICATGENYRNCPQDCIETKEERKIDPESLPDVPVLEEGPIKEDINLVLILLIALIIASIIIGFYSVKRGKRREILEIDNYILNSRKANYSDESIKKALLKSSWSKKEINKAFKSLRK